MLEVAKKTTAGDRFSRYFTVGPALSDALRHEVFRIRHEVYAREFGFEPVRADGQETDHYDAHSLQCIVRTAGAAPKSVGCARLIMTNPRDPQAPLPFELACRHSLNRAYLDPAKLPRGRIAEVSRLAVMADFRRRKGEAGSALTLQDNDFGGAPIERVPNIPLSLYIASVIMAQRHGIDYLFVLTEPRLSKHFAKLGVQITSIGAPIDHRGIRVPSVMRVADVYAGLRSLIKPVWHEISAQVEAAYSAAEVVAAAQANLHSGQRDTDSDFVYL
jgi:N-acyl amino acid synthase of PEP-CTERM/exosortase system